MTNEMPERIYVWKPEILHGEFTASSRPHKSPAVEYTRTDLCVPQDVLQYVADVLNHYVFVLKNTRGSQIRGNLALAALQPYLKEKP